MKGEPFQQSIGLSLWLIIYDSLQICTKKVQEILDCKLVMRAEKVHHLGQEPVSMCWASEAWFKEPLPGPDHKISLHDLFTRVPLFNEEEGQHRRILSSLCSRGQCAHALRLRLHKRTVR